MGRLRHEELLRERVQRHQYALADDVMSAVKPEIHERSTHPQVTELAARRAPEQAWKQFAQAQTPEEFCGSWLSIQCHAIGGVSDGVVILQKPGTQSFAPVAFYPENPHDRLHLAELSERALKEGRGVVQPNICEFDQQKSGKNSHR